ncbi:MAG: hypothetical protein SFY32_08675, partial [Bacteroidota bacterium]|nr:hypothetical protein [Bacteroidota bacterium]
MSKWNFSYQLDNSAFINSQYRLISSKDSITIYIKMQFDINDRKFKNLLTKQFWYFDYNMRTSYETRFSTAGGYFIAERQIIKDDTYLFKFKIKKPTESSAYLFISLYEDNQYAHLID